MELERIRMHGRRDGDVEYQRIESTILSWDDGNVSMSNIDDAMTVDSSVDPLLGVVTVWRSGNC
ncbi:hypothetical protein CRG98_047726 [Punica granatum]|uniref:Uncharacterized protein n=1 Tax=Punica granatum TaxID=22663 RepID=A0A2I0HJJ7_PUNGR|nr:hypothetical protein CRG98_047726 [Punica granatum]